MMSAGFILTLVLVFGAVFVLLWMLMGEGSRRRREQVLARRMRAADREDRVERPARATAVPGAVRAMGRGVAEAMGFAETLDRRLDRAGLPLNAGEFVVGSVLAALAGGLLGAVLLEGLLFVVVFAAGAAVVPFVLMEMGIRRRASKLHGQLPDILTLLASSLRAGHSFLQAVDMVAHEIGDPGGEEFGRAVAEIRLGRPESDALLDLAARTGSQDLDWAVLAVNIQREVGGNLAEVLDTVAGTIRERETVRRQVKVLSAEGRLSAGILTALPFLIGLYIAKVNPGYLRLLFTTRVGLIMFAVAASLMVLGILWMRKLVRIDV